MRYLEIAEIYEELEKHSSKLKKTEIIADLLKKTPEDDLREVVLLLQGRVFPNWSEEILGVAHKLMIKAIIKISGRDEKQIVKGYRQTGDLGKTAEELISHKKQMTFGKKELTVDRVFDDLVSISRQSGKGSQEGKLKLIAGLLGGASGKEARYIVRTVLEELRVGVAKGILRDAIASAFLVDKDEVEKMLDLRQDYGEVAEILKKHGKSGCRIKITIGRPMALMLGEKAKDLEEAIKNFEHIELEYKYDGLRLLIHKDDDKVWLFTRNHENVTKQFPDVVEFARKYVHAKECIIDSECLVYKSNRPMPFQFLSRRIKRKYDINDMVKQYPVVVRAFDIVYYNGQELFSLSLSERLKILDKIITRNNNFKTAKRLITNDLKKAEEFYESALKAGHEGIMVKNLDAEYRSGRRVGYWLKVKPTLESLDLVIIGATWGTGKRVGWFGSFILGCRDEDKFLECGMLGTGIKEKDADVTFKELTKMLKPLIEREAGNMVWFKPKIVIEVDYEEIQKSPKYSSGYALRFPRMKRIRFDKGVKDADTLKRVEHLFEIQKGGKR